MNKEYMRRYQRQIISAVAVRPPQASPFPKYVLWAFLVAALALIAAGLLNQL